MTLRWGGKELIGWAQAKTGRDPSRSSATYLSNNERYGDPLGRAKQPREQEQNDVINKLNRRVLGLGYTLIALYLCFAKPSRASGKSRPHPPSGMQTQVLADHRGIALFTDGGGLGLGGKPHLPDPSSDLNHVDDAAPPRFSKAPSQPEWLGLGLPFGSSTPHVVMTTGSVLAEAVLEASQR
ncbi:uncharacterized protein P884DRAFT_309943 [Thermothelomyces heterothallicus CBS 202.75]|uniref:uncharacterized protein n=1 Tax=Thermothelomyces heterothallicus CBS 202.75 TaxID=1149848 RepID=UPI0037424603